MIFSRRMVFIILLLAAPALTNFVAQASSLQCEGRQDACATTAVDALKGEGINPQEILNDDGSMKKPEDTPKPWRLLVHDSLAQKIQILERDGRAVWEYAEPGQVYDGEMLPGGNILYCWFDPKQKKAGVREVTPEKKVVFEYEVARECHSVQRLEGGLTLIEDPSNKRLIEVDRQGKIVHELKLQVGHDQVHRMARQCRRLPGGNTLVCQELDKTVIEYASDGAIVRRIPVNGYVFSATRLPNGNTLIGTGGGEGIGKEVLELDPQGKTVWSFTAADFPPDTNLDWVLGVERLPGGNTLIANYLGHGKDGQGISMLEVTPEKKVVWTLRGKRILLLARRIP